MRIALILFILIISVGCVHCIIEKKVRTDYIPGEMPFNVGAISSEYYHDFGNWPTNNQELVNYLNNHDSTNVYSSESFEIINDQLDSLLTIKLPSMYHDLIIDVYPNLSGFYKFIIFDECRKQSSTYEIGFSDEIII